MAVMMPRVHALTPWALWAILFAVCSIGFVSASGDSSEGGGHASSSEENDDAFGNDSSVDYFSVPAFFICFRETIEVCSSGGVTCVVFVVHVLE